MEGAGGGTRRNENVGVEGFRGEEISGVEGGWVGEVCGVLSLEFVDGV